MSSTRSLLVELFVEELPPKALKRLGESFAQALAGSLKAQRSAKPILPMKSASRLMFAAASRVGLWVTGS